VGLVAGATTTAPEDQAFGAARELIESRRVSAR
jgi:hypothetical protein